MLHSQITDFSNLWYLGANMKFREEIVLVVKGVLKLRVMPITQDLQNLNQLPQVKLKINSTQTSKNIKKKRSQTELKLNASHNPLITRFH